MARVPPALRRYATDVRTTASRYAPHLLVLAAFVTILAVATGLFPYHSANHDEGVYLQQAAMLLDGHLTIHPPVEDAFRPWFFVENGDTLYPKYAPVPAAIFALPLALGVPRVALALVGAAIVGLTYDVTRQVFDRRTGLLAGALLLASPLFVLDTATFLPYAPTAALNLAFAASYLHAETSTTRRAGNRWAALAGLTIGLAFFARPYTAVLFAAPFVLHAGWRLVGEATSLARAHDTLARVPAALVRTPLGARRLRTGALGLLGVALALAYNWRLTGDPLVFPYQAFAPLDGLGFGRREILGHGIRYTPELALRVNARVLWTYVVDWAPLGALGSLFAGVGMVAARRRWDWRRAIIVGVVPAVALGNVAFWGNHNILGAVGVPGDGLIAILGPYYHFDLLLPTAAFAAHGLVVTGTRVSTFLDGARLAGRPVPQDVATSVVLVAFVLFSAGTTATAFADPVARNAGVTAEYEQAYAHFTDANGPPDDAVVFLPEPYGPWLNHPFQALRNDPGYRGDTLYALQENEFAVVDAFPDRRSYRYAYRGTWNPFDGASVTPTLQPVRTVAGDRVSAELTLDLPAGATSTSLRLASGAEHAYYAAPADESTRHLTLHVNGSSARVTGPGVTRVGDGTVGVDSTADVVLEVNVNTPGGGYAYRVVLPVSTTTGGDRRALTPVLEVCTVPRLCGGGAAYVPGEAGSPFEMNVTMHAE